jgi:hypothetical protein
MALLAGIGFDCLLYAVYVTPADKQWILQGRNDFAMMYTSAKLVGTPYFYDPIASFRAKEKLTGDTSPARLVTRLPYWAAFLWPLGRMSYPPAYWLFQAISVGALAGAIVLWPGNRAAMLLACCWSWPVFAVLTEGQDVFFLVLWIALAARWASRRPFAAGMALALCASKFHLFLPLPLVLAARREGRVAAGLGLGGTLLAAVSFAVAGVDWPLRWFRIVANPVVNPSPEIMPNLHNLVRGLPEAAVWEAVLALACLAAVWVVARRTNWQIGLAAALVAGLLTSVHAYMGDCTLLIPAVLLLAASGIGWLRLAGITLLFPVWYLLLYMGEAGRILPAALLALLAALAWEALRSGCDPYSRAAEPAHSSHRIA